MAPATAPNAAATIPTAANGNGDTDGSNSQTFEPNQHFGLGAYRSTLTSGLQLALQQLKGGSTDAGGTNTSLAVLENAFQTLMRDFGGTQSSVSTSYDPSTVAKLQSFLIDLMANQHSNGGSEPAVSGAIVSTVA